MKSEEKKENFVKIEENFGKKRRKFREKRRNFLFRKYANFKTFFVLRSPNRIFSFSHKSFEQFVRVVSVIHTEKKNRIKISGIK